MKEFRGTLGSVMTSLKIICLISAGNPRRDAMKGFLAVFASNGEGVALESGVFSRIALQLALPVSTRGSPPSPRFAVCSGVFMAGFDEMTLSGASMAGFGKVTLSGAFMAGFDEMVSLYSET